MDERFFLFCIFFNKFIKHFIFWLFIFLVCGASNFFLLLWNFVDPGRLRNEYNS